VSFVQAWMAGHNDYIDLDYRRPANKATDEMRLHRRGDGGVNCHSETQWTASSKETRLVR